MLMRSLSSPLPVHSVNAQSTLANHMQARTPNSTTEGTSLMATNAGGRTFDFSAAAHPPSTMDSLHNVLPQAQSHQQQQLAQVNSLTDRAASNALAPIPLADGNLNRSRSSVTDRAANVAAAAASVASKAASALNGKASSITNSMQVNVPVSAGASAIKASTNKWYSRTIGRVLNSATSASQNCLPKGTTQCNAPPAPPGTGPLLDACGDVPLPVSATATHPRLPTQNHDSLPITPSSSVAQNLLAGNATTPALTQPSACTQLASSGSRATGGSALQQVCAPSAAGAKERIGGINPPSSAATLSHIPIPSKSAALGPSTPSPTVLDKNGPALQQIRTANMHAQHSFAAVRNHAGTNQKGATGSIRGRTLATGSARDKTGTVAKPRSTQLYQKDTSQESASRTQAVPEPPRTWGT